MTKVQLLLRDITENSEFDIVKFHSVTEILMHYRLYSSKPNGRILKEAREYLASKFDISHFTSNGSKPLKYITKICPVCKKEFSRALSTKTAMQITCSYACSNTYFRSGINNPNYKEGTNYRQVALNFYGKQCNNCGFNQDEDALEVHHIDKNRNNNKINNLMVLCANCHTILHKLLK